MLKVLKKIQPEEIYHFAWYGIPIFDKKNFRKNIAISKNLIEGINSINCKKLIISGSGAEYGYNNKNCQENTDQSNDLTNLGKQKNYIRKLFFKSMNKKICLIWFRVFYIFGKKQRAGSLLKTLIKAKNDRDHISLKFPNIYNDYIYIKDVINGILKLRLLKKTQIINICSAKAVSNLQFVKIFEKINQTSILKNSKKRFLKKKKLVGSNLKLRRLGWRIKYSLEDALKEICL